jgi:hypothetical protein
MQAAFFSNHPTQIETYHKQKECLDVVELRNAGAKVLIFNITKGMLLLFRT